jgi:hypothetical protein
MSSIDKINTGSYNMKPKIQNISPFESLRNNLPENVYDLMAHIATRYGATNTISSIASVSEYAHLSYFTSFHLLSQSH